MMHNDNIDGGLEPIGPSAPARLEVVRGADIQTGLNGGKGVGASASDVEPRLISAGNASSLLVPTTDGSIYLPCEGIVRLQAEGSYTHIHTDKGERLLTCKGVGLLHKQLPLEWFHRCHNTHVINLKKVHKLLRTGGCRVQMVTGEMVEVSRRKWRELQDVMSSLRS